MGTGINVKTVQAMAYGMPLVTTTLGSKGIETNEPMHNYPDVESLVRGLLSVSRSPQQLNSLASLSKERYKHFLDAADNNIIHLLKI